MAERTEAGVFVEFGVYKGGSALRLAEVARRKGRLLYLFDTFKGIPFRDKGDAHLVGDFSDTDEQAVRDLIPDAVFHVGVFPHTMPAEFPRVAFLHIDADQYQSYADAIRLFAPLMEPDGVMWFDDVGCLPAADRAVNEVFADSLKRAECGKYFVRF